MSLDSALSLTTNLLQRRNDLRRLLGERYPEQVAVARKVLCGYAAEHKLDLAKAALTIGKQMDQAGQSPNLIFAAFVEECQVEAAHG